jgi:hypothetical protein
LLAKDDRQGLQQIVLDVCKSYSSTLITCYIINRDGIMLAHAPRADFMIGGDFSWRDHFLGAKALGIKGASGSVHISRVYHGKSDNLYKFAISAPILDHQNNFLGTIATSVTTDASLGPVILKDGRTVALIAPTDINSPDERRTDKYVALYHPGYRKGIDPVEFPYMNKVRMKLGMETSQELQLADSKLANFQNDDYADPVASVAKEYAGRWIAGVAPVGNTGFAVIVQQRYTDAVNLESSTFWNLALWSALASLVAIGILVILPWRWLRRRRFESGS